MKIKRLSIAFLAFTLAFSGAMVPKAASADVNTILEKALQNYKVSIAESKLSDKLDGFFNPEDNVRIIVELESKPGIVIANDRDVSYSSLSVNEKKSISANLITEQQTIKNQIKSKSVNMDYKQNFTVAMNGFSGVVKFKDIQIIERLEGVKKVYLANEYEKPEVKTDMVTSGDMVTASQTWALDFEGEEQVIAILDTGIDYTHKDMMLSPETDVTLTEDNVEALGLKGKYFTNKVPYGYNYYDLNNEVIDKGPDPSMHGMHVAGTAGANGDPENGGIKGIAPESQLLAMKVFSNDPIYATTFSDIYLVAIDESIKLGADVINMSLGSTASFYIADSAESVALENAVENGIVAAVSAGNSGNLTHGWTDTYGGYPWASNPDVGVVGAPGLNAPTLQVASIENTNQQSRYISYLVDSVVQKAPMSVAGPTDPKTLNADVEYAYGGLGKPEELANVEGKVALIIRGELDFVTKITNASNAGAIGVIVYNHAAGGEELINMMYPSGLTIPAAFIGNKAGVELSNLTEKVLTFESDTIQIANPNAGKMSDFSSWGTTPTLEIKPEISAPGGQIYSTMNNNTYGMMSGTSMAAPHVAGGSALVMEYVESNPKFEGLSDLEKSEMVKTLLMNTATSVVDAYDYDISPRSQGAGLMNLFGAVTSPVILTNTATGEPKVELKDFESNKFTLRLTATNFSDEVQTYAVDTTVLEDYVLNYGTTPVTGLGSDYVEAEIVAPETIEIPANGSFDFEVKVDFSGDTTVKRNMFVEGFVHLTDVNDENPIVGVPYVGFYGDWSEPAIIDGLATSDKFGPSYFEFSGFGYIYNDGIYFNDDENLFISPKTETGKAFGTDNILPILSFLRNAEEVNYKITDKEGKQLRNIFTSQWERKDYIDGGRYNPYSIVENALWDGTINGTVAEDGQYIYEITAKIQGDTEYQSYKMPVGVDTSVPVVEAVSYDEETKTLTFKATDEGSGLQSFMFEVNGVLIEGEVPAEEGKDTYSFTLSSETPSVSEVNIIAFDNVFNMSETPVEVPFDEDPFIYILEPVLLQIYDESTVTVEGYVTNVNYLDKVLINETIEATVEFVEDATVNHPDDGSVIYKGPAFKYTAEVELEDGYQEMTIKAVSNNGAEGSLARRFYVDTTAPVIEAEVESRESNSSEATINFTLSDNLGYLTLFHNDSQIFRYEAELVINGQTEKTFEYDVNLVDGENVFTFKLVDGAGHETTESVTITKSDVEVENVIRIKGANRYQTAVEVSKEQFDSATDVVLASGLNFPDALAGAVLAKSVNGPVLLTRNESLSSSTKDELVRLGAKNIHILGGEGAVSESVSAELESLGYTIVRYSGKNRYATAVELGKAVLAKNPGNTVVLTNSDDFGELLAGNAYAAANNYPALFTRSNVLSASTKQALIDWEIKNVQIIGDETSVSEAVVTELTGLGITVERTAGTNRELTSLEVAKHFFTTSTKAVVAYGYDYPDALVGGSFAASINAPILLVDKDSIDPAILSYIDSNIDEVIVLGGSSAVSDDVVNSIKIALE